MESALTTDLPQDRIRHLEMIQSTIDRMTAESARMKQFCLASVAVIASTATATQAWELGVAGALLTVGFWVLDSRYLTQERWFRALYDDVRKDSGPSDFLMTPSPEVRARHRHWRGLSAWSAAPLYVSLVVINLCIAVSATSANTKSDVDLSGSASSM